MITTNQKKMAALTGLGLLWGGILTSQWPILEEPVRVPLTNVSGSGSSSRGTGGAVDGLRVQLDLLASARTQRDMTFTPPRNIFAPPHPDDTEVTRANRPEIEPGSGQALLQEAVLAGLSQFHYLGFVRMEDGWRKKGELAVLTKNDDLHLVRTGEIVEDQVMVKKITEESVTLRDRRSRVEYTVLLSEEAPVQP